MARYVMCCTKCNLQHITLAKRAWVGMAPKSPSPFSILRSADLITLFIARFMTDNRKRAGRKPKADTTVFRCSVNFTATEQAILMSMYDKVQVESMSAFIKMVLFEKPFKVFYVDENTRVFIDKLSSFNALYRTVGVEYGLIVKTLRDNFNGLAYPRITGFPQHTENNNVNNCFDFINMLMAGDWHYIVICKAYMAKEPTNHYDSSVL